MCVNIYLEYCEVLFYDINVDVFFVIGSIL